MVRQLLAACVGLFLATGGAVAGAAESEPSSADFFAPGKVWKVHLELSAEEYAAIQPPLAGGFPFGPPAAPGTPPAAAPERPSELNLFGTAFPWGQGRLTIDETVLPAVGVRYDGDATYFASAMGLKRPWRLQLDRFGGPAHQGQTTLLLHPATLDPSRTREVLAFAMFSACGVPSPRTSLAEVSLSVPGQFERVLLGLYTVVEHVSPPLLERTLGKGDGLLMKPARMRGLDYLGENWAAYDPAYRPQQPATADQARRVIDFARLIQQAPDDEFTRRVGEYLDLGAFSRFLAANALLANVESFFALGHNYYLYLEPTSNRFFFLPADLEFSLANLLLMGTGEQLLELSVMHPYPGENRLTDRLLAWPDFAAQYRRTLEALAAEVVTTKQLLTAIESFEAIAQEPLERERAALARVGVAGPPGGFGPGPGAFGPAPQPPDLRKFAVARPASVADQLRGESTGYVPQFSFGPPRPAPDETPISEATLPDQVTAPPGFKVTLFAGPPDVSYPVAISAAANGDVYIAVDEQGSLGRTPQGGKILRCRDADGDGRADQFSEFARLEHPRGVLARGNAVWIVHPPQLSVLHDDDGDGVSDRQETLVEGLTTELITERGGDHTTNCVRQGIDGWLYIGVGDYGIREARGKDGRTISLRGGGVVRVRPDGTQLETFATGLRNPFDLAIDPELNLFTRDNTNDGGGWDVRVSHLWQTGEFGYPRLFANFTGETLPPLGVFGGGGGTGALYVDHPAWPPALRGDLLTGDWGRSEIYRHALAPHGASFDLTQEVFFGILRPTGMDLDPDGRLLVASWRGGEASVYVGPNVGFIACLRPDESVALGPIGDLRSASVERLLAGLAAPRAVERLECQHELLHRGLGQETLARLEQMAASEQTARPGRIAALFTLAQSAGEQSRPALLRLAKDDQLREFALRALTDQEVGIQSLQRAPLLAALQAALTDDAPRVRAQAIVSLGRLGDVSAAQALLPLTRRPDDAPLPTAAPAPNQPDPARVIPHLAVRTLAELGAVDACLEALDGPYSEGALAALRLLHQEKVVEGLIRRLGSARSPELRQGILSALVRLYHREADYDGSWWGIRPDSTGPYYDGREWEQSPRIAAVLTSAALDSDAESLAGLQGELARHQVQLPGIPAAAEAAAESETAAPLAIPATDPDDPHQIGNLDYDRVLERALAAAGDAARGRELFAAQSCRSCHTDTDGQRPKGPHLVDIGKRYAPRELLESVLRPSAKIAQGYEAYSFILEDGRVLSGFVVSEGASRVRLRDAAGVEHETPRDQIEERVRQEQSAMPLGLVNNLTPEQLADLLAYLRSL